MGCMKSKGGRDDQSSSSLVEKKTEPGPDNPLQTSQYGATNSVVETEDIEATTTSEIISAPLAVSAKPISQFCYLEKSYSIKTPFCLVPRINELFKSICDRYDVVVVNREKVDEALTLFKQVVGADKLASMSVCFSKWKSCLINPKFTISFNQKTGDVKDIRVRADNIPKVNRRAQKHIRDLIDACHLYLQQKDFLQRQIIADIVQLGSLSSQLQSLGKEANLTSAERKQLPKTYSSVREEFSGFSDILDTFFVHIHSLMNEINTSVHVLEAREGSTDP